MDHTIKFLKHIINLNSHTSNREGVNAVSAAIKNELESIGLVWSKYSSSANPNLGDLIVASSKKKTSGKPNIILSGHLDTVFKHHRDFNIRIENGKLYGPGTIDMKAGLVVIRETLKALAKQGRLENISVVFTPDEEGQKANHFPQLTEILKDATHLMVYEGDGSAPKSFIDSERRVVVQRKGALGYTLKAKASGGHAGVLGSRDSRHSAVHELLQHGKQILELANFELGTTTNVGEFKGGIAHNSLAETAEMMFDARVTSEEELSRVKNFFESIPERPFDPEVSMSIEPYYFLYPLEYSEANKQFYKVVETAAQGIGVTVEPEFRGGGSDANRFAYHNKSLAILDNFGPIGGNEHTSQEFVYIDSIESSIKFSLAVISKLLSQ